MDLPEVTTATLMDPRREAQLAGVDRPGADKQAAAHRLRARGFSYRRIAATLRIRYDTVSRWLCGDPPAPSQGLASGLTFGPPSGSPAPPIPAPAQRQPTLEHRLTALELALARYQDDATRREERLLTALAAVREALEATAGIGRGRSDRGSLGAPWPAGRERA